MFYFSYLKAELLRRFGKTVTIALGLSIASTIIISIISVSSSLQASQAEVLDPLSAVGTDMLVTRTVSTDNMQEVDAATREDMVADNRVSTDLSQLGEAGDQFSNDTFAAGGNLTFDASETQNMDSSLVADYATGLIMNVTHQEGTIPTITATFHTGGQTYSRSQDVNFDSSDMAAFDEARQQAEAEVEAQGIDPRSEEGRALVREKTAGLMPRRSVTMEFTTPEEDVTQNVDTPETDIQTSSYTIAGVDTSNTDMGLILPSQIIDGSYFTASTVATDETASTEETDSISDDASTETASTDEATSNETAAEDTTDETAVEPSASEIIVSQSYAQKQSIAVNDTIPINDHTFTVVGIVEPKLYTNTADLYVTLPVLQDLSGKTDRVNIVLVKSTDAANVDASTASLESLFTGATVTSAVDTAEQVSGSLMSVANLMNKFVGVVSIIVLIAAFVIVSLLTLLSVNKRVREIGTLKAFGWGNVKIVRQILMENLVLGILGAGLGIGLSVLAIHILNSANITLNADIVSLNSSLGGMVGRFMGGPGMRGATEASTDASTDAVSTSVTLNVTYAWATLAIGSAVAIVGSLLAGLLASFKAASMRPQEALRNLE